MARMGRTILWCEVRRDWQPPAKHEAPKTSALFVKLLTGTRSPSTPLNAGRRSSIHFFIPLAYHLR